MKIYNRLDHLRSHPDAFLRPGISAGRSIVLSLIETATYDGVVEFYATDSGGLEIVCFGGNWIRSFYGEDRYDSFSLIPLAGMQNTFRGEVLLSAFCKSYSFHEAGRTLFMSVGGEVGLDPRISEITDKFKFSIVFEVHDLEKD